MKKVLFNKYVKLIEMLCLLIVIGVLLYEGIKCCQIEKSVPDEMKRLQEEIVDCDKINDAMYVDILSDVNKIILAHKNGGMQGIADLLATDGDMAYRIDVYAADKEQAYDKYSDVFDIDYIYWYAEKPREKAYSNVEDGYETYRGEAGCSLLITQYIRLRKFEDNSYSVENISKGDILTEEAVEYLNSIKYELHIAICNKQSYTEKIVQEHWDTYYRELKEIEYVSVEQYAVSHISAYVCMGIIALVCMILLAVSCGREIEGKKVLNAYEKGYTETHLAVIILLLKGLIVGAIVFYNDYTDIDFAIGSTELNVIDAGFVVVMVLGAAWLLYELGIILKKFINKCFISDWLIVKAAKKIAKWCRKIINKFAGFIKQNYDNSKYAALPHIKKTFIRKVIIDIAVLIVVILLCCMINMWYMDINRIIYITTFVLVALYYANSLLEYAKLREYNSVIKAIDIIYSGDYDGVEIDENEKNEEMYRLANLSSSFKESVRKQVEAEKMQVDLIANVSHDLKTPLTSIISYVDLLKEEEMSDVAKDYVKVLEDKSARLKYIVADVFDLAKATSGEQIAVEQLDGVVLINQVLSDMSDKIEEKGKDLRVKLQVETAPIMGNGQKLYRVFQNVIDNALKYSMPGTRIYINAEIQNNEFVVSLKNISEFEIDYTSEEIMSRFTRGDKARHSEGNGLGLSIAKSFTELCGGSFEVKLDDDVFKVIIRLKNHNNS